MAGGTAVLAVDAGLGRQRRHPLGLDQRDGGNERQVQAHQHEAGDQGTGVHVTHGATQLVSQHDQHQRGRDGLRQRARGGDGAGGNGAVVAIAQHDGQRDQAHGNDRSSHHARGGGQQRAHQHDRDRQTAAHRAKHLGHGFQQVLGHAAALQDDAHEREERNGQQRVVLHDAEHAQRQRLEQVGGEQPDLHADQAEEQAGGRQGKRHRKAGQQEEQQAREHQRDEVVGNDFHGGLAQREVAAALAACWCSAWAISLASISVSLGPVWSSGSGPCPVM